MVFKRKNYTILKENGLISKKERRRRYPTETMTDANYADYRALIANTPAQAESSLYSPEQAAGDIHLYVSTENKKEPCPF